MFVLRFCFEIIAAVNYNVMIILLHLELPCWRYIQHKVIRWEPVKTHSMRAQVKYSLKHRNRTIKLHNSNQANWEPVKNLQTMGALNGNL